jgi:hypothetical protein
MPPPIAMPLDEVKHLEKISSVFGGTFYFYENPYCITFSLYSHLSIHLEQATELLKQKKVYVFFQKTHKIPKCLDGDLPLLS